MRMVPWTIFGAKSRPGWHVDASDHSGSVIFGDLLVENDAPRVVLESQGNQKSAQNRILGARSAL